MGDFKTRSQSCTMAGNATSLSTGPELSQSHLMSRTETVLGSLIDVHNTMNTLYIISILFIMIIMKIMIYSDKVE